MEATQTSNALNFSVGYWERTGQNFTGASTVVNAFLCPSASRLNSQRDNPDPLDSVSQSFGTGYGYGDYAATFYVDINPTGTATGYSAATPYRNPSSRANGLLKGGKTLIAEVTDGTSNTVAIGEDAGRDERFVAFYTETSSGGDLRGLGPWSTSCYRRNWRWVEPQISLGVSGQPNNPYRPMYSTTPYPTSAGTNVPDAGANDELFSFHSGGVNCLFGDGSVRFLKNSISLTVLRGIITLNGGEVISSDAL
jgi:prepilin-type processing-associated H-X9-DG protein